MSDVRIEGIDKLSKRLKQLEDKLGRKEAVRILKSAAHQKGNEEVGPESRVGCTNPSPHAVARKP